jgi:hypothetical protein
MSREHIVTKAICLDNEMTVTGMPWCPKPKKVSVANLTAKVLCVAHNSALSEVDQEAVRFVEALRESLRLLAVRIHRKNYRWRTVRFPVNGYILERWLLKTLINAAYGRGCRIGADSAERGEPSNALVEIAFGQNRFQPSAGMYGVYDEFETRPKEDGIDILVYNAPVGVVQGAVFSFLGFRLLLHLDRNGPTMPLMEISVESGEAADIVEPTYHPKSVTYNAGTGVSHMVEFVWTSGHKRIAKKNARS